LLDAVAEEFMLVERATGEILWVSYPCRNIAHKLGSTKNLSEFPSLQKLIYDAIPDNPQSKVRARWHTNDGKWQQYIGDNRNATVSVFVQPHQTNYFWVRFYRSSDQDQSIRESLAAHERLFSTSRDVSVREIVTTLSHELNQPLGTLVNILNGLKTRLSGGSEAGVLAEGLATETVESRRDIFNALELASRQGQFASDVLQRLRDFSKLRKPVISTFNVSDLVESTLQLLDWMFIENAININLNIAGQSICLRGDITLLQQVLVNLLRNAVDAMDKSIDKSIDIEVYKEKGNVVIAISDTGHGLKEGEEDNIFIPFNSVKTTGMGIGLNICRSFIELHQGKFWFSNNTDAGCTVTIVLPNAVNETQA
jgi:signal transduction histidine kinase